MAMWDSIPMKKIIVTVLHLQIGIVNDYLSNLIDFIDYDVEKVYIGEEVARNTLVTVKQVI